MFSFKIKQVKFYLMYYYLFRRKAVIWVVLKNADNVDTVNYSCDADVRRHRQRGHRKLSRRRQRSVSTIETRTNKTVQTQQLIGVAVRWAVSRWTIRGVWKCKYGKVKYDYARVENASTEKASTNVQRWKMQVWKNEVTVRSMNTELLNSAEVTVI